VISRPALGAGTNFLEGFQPWSRFMIENARWALRHSVGLAIAMLVGASVALTLGFACALPLAAFAAISGLMFDRRGAGGAGVASGRSIRPSGSYACIIRRIRRRSPGASGSARWDLPLCSRRAPFLRA
jgi:hypothetical protein